MTLRANGSYIGTRASEVSTEAASGVWDLRTVQRQRAAAAWPTVFEPDSLSGLQLWLDAADSSTLYDATNGGSLVAADGTVKRWEDKSGNGRHATEGANGPQRKTAAQGGLDALYFDGTDDKMVVVGSASSMKFMHGANATFFVVTRPGTTANPDALLNILDTNAGSSSRVGFRIAMDDRSSVSRNDALSFYATAGGGNTVFDSVVSSALTANAYQLISVAYRPNDATAANRASYYVDAGFIANSNTATGSPSYSDSTYDLHIGARGTLSAFLNGNIAEILIYDSALSDTDRESVESYLLAKWGIS